MAEGNESLGRLQCFLNWPGSGHEGAVSAGVISGEEVVSEIQEAAELSDFFAEGGEFLLDAFLPLGVD